MDSGSVAVEGRPSSCVRNRSHYRHAIISLAYVRLDHGNGGIIRNISESGIAIQAVGRLHKDQLVHLRFDLLKPKIRIDITGQVAWADSTGQAGLQFVDVPPRMQRQLRDWIFSDLLAIATEFGPTRSPIFGRDPEDEFDAPKISGILPPNIGLPPDPQSDIELPPAAQPEMPMRFGWWPGDIYPSTLGRLIDSLVVFSAVLLFAVVAVEMIGIFPTALAATGMGVGLALILGAVYHVLFKYLLGSTLGRHLAKVAAEDVSWVQPSDEHVTRFR